MRPIRLLRPVAAAALIPAVLSACAVGPTYETPSIPPEAAGPFVSAEAGPFSAGEVRTDWWRIYEDPQLDQLVTEALEANRDIAVAAANLAQGAQAGEQTVGIDAQVGHGVARVVGWRLRPPVWQVARPSARWLASAAKVARQNKELEWRPTFCQVGYRSSSAW